MIRKSLYFIAVTCFIINLFITAILTLSFNTRYYDKMYSKLNVAETIGISDADLKEATTGLLDYIKGDRIDLNIKVDVEGKQVEMFNQREKDHMVDVKNLYHSVYMFRAVSSIFVAIMILLSMGVGDYVNFKLNRNILQTSLIFLLLAVGFIGSYAVLDFESFWIDFHKLVFTNDLWLLNPNVDRLIMMVPYEFFLGLVMQIVIAITVICAGCVGVWYYLNKVVIKNDSRSIV